MQTDITTPNRQFYRKMQSNSIAFFDRLQNHHICPECEMMIFKKNNTTIGGCRVCCESKTIYEFWIEPQWQKKGYGTYFFKKALHRLGAFSGTDVFALCQSHSPAMQALLKKFGFVCLSDSFLLQDKTNACVWARQLPKQLTSLSIAHELLKSRICKGDFVVDATAGLGRDTAFLCELVGESGKVLAMDIQQKAVDCTNALLKEKGLSHIGTAILANHAELEQYVAPNTADAVVFNFGWLPSGNHNVFTTAKTSLPALQAALNILKSGGCLVACVYHGRENGTEEKDLLSQWFSSLDMTEYSVLQCGFVNRQNKDPLVFLVQSNKAKPIAF